MKLYDIIEYINNDNLLAYKHPCEDFNTNSKLIVRESQVAIFVKNGKICDVFSAGRYNLKTENIPILKKLINIATKGETSFSAEVYFFDTTDIMSVKWGTACPMELQDSRYNVILKVGASGEAMFSISNCENFLRKILGTKGSFDKAWLIEFFRGLINTYIKNCLSDAVTKENISILQINSKLMTISETTNSFINSKLEEFGVYVKNLVMENVIIQEDDSLAKLKNSLNKRAEMDILGYNYSQERSFDVMQDIAQNESGGGGGLTSNLLNLGLGIGVAKSVGQNINQMTDKISLNNNQPSNSFCNKCGAPCANDALFCSKCGNKIEKQQKLFCSQCGIECTSEATFCSKCGNKLK